MWFVITAGIIGWLGCGASLYMYRRFIYQERKALKTEVAELKRQIHWLEAPSRDRLRNAVSALAARTPNKDIVRRTYLKWHPGANHEALGEAIDEVLR